MASGFNRSVVGFIYNYPCPLRCNFCCHTSDVVGGGRFNPNNVLKIVEEFGRDKSVIRFAFSGGDPFLYFDEIVGIMTEARKRNVFQPFHMVSSGYWAADYDTTMAKLTVLHELGSDAIDISYDYEHQRFVPLENIERIIACTGELGMRCEIFGIFWDPADQLSDILGAQPPHVSLQTGLAMPMGAAKAFFGKGARYSLPDKSKSRCGNAGIYAVAIYPDGAVYPCCSGGFNREAKLECGNAFTDSAETILANVYTQFHARIAKEIGFDQLYERISHVAPDVAERLPRFAEVDSVCQICRDIHRDQKLMDALKGIYQQMEVEYVIDRVERDWPRLHAET